jgi:DNA replication licensing factor MCM6
LLRQSIIHVEQDDIDFDEEELQGERGDKRAPIKERPNEEEDTQMETDDADESMTPTNVRAYRSPAQRTSPAPSSTGAGPSSYAGPAPPAPKKKMVISHDQYLQMQSLIILHLSEVERETGAGMDREDLVDWYLESKEDQMQDVEDLDYERELVTKVLRKLVKVRKYTCI